MSKSPLKNQDQIKEAGAVLAPAPQLGSELKNGESKNLPADNGNEVKKDEPLAPKAEDSIPSINPAAIIDPPKEDTAGKVFRNNHIKKFKEINKGK